MFDRSRLSPAVLLSALFALLFTLDGCSTTNVGPSTTLTLTVAGRIDRSVISNGETATLTFEISNPTGHDITLTFADACGPLPRIADRATGTVVYPGGCATVITTVTVSSAGRVTQVGVQAGDTPPRNAFLPLRPGEYEARVNVAATVNGERFLLQSNTVPFSVR